MRAAARLLSLTLKAGEGTTLPTRSPTTQRILLGRTGAGVHVLKVGVRLQNLTHDKFFRPTQDGQQLANNIVMLGAGLALLGSKK